MHRALDRFIAQKVERTSGSLSCKLSPVMDQLADFLQALGYYTIKGYPYLAIYPHLLVSALFPIYAGAHASLSRPSSAAKPPRKIKKGDDDDNDEAEEQDQAMEGLGPTDALLLPLFAGLSLTSLYFLIKWLEDPALLNKILNWYFAIFGVWSLARMIRDSIGIFTSFVFPEIYGNIREVDAKQRKPKLPSRQLDVRIYIHKIMQAQFSVGPQGVTSLFLAVVVRTI